MKSRVLLALLLAFVKIALGQPADNQRGRSVHRSNTGPSNPGPPGSTRCVCRKPLESPPESPYQPFPRPKIGDINPISCEGEQPNCTECCKKFVERTFQPLPDYFHTILGYTLYNICTCRRDGEEPDFWCTQDCGECCKKHYGHDAIDIFPKRHGDLEAKVPGDSKDSEVPVSSP